MAETKKAEAAPSTVTLVSGLLSCVLLFVASGSWRMRSEVGFVENSNVAGTYRGGSTVPGWSDDDCGTE